MIWTVLFFVSVTIIVLYFISTWKYNYWKKQNVPYLQPTPLLGNYGDFILLKKHMSYVLDEICKKFPNEPYIGAYFGTEPTLIVKDPELLKLITTKDFYYFNGRETSAYVHKESFTRNIFNNNGDEWKVVRQNLTPIFTSAKMRNMFHLIAKSAYGFENLLDVEHKISDKIAVRNLVVRYTMSCITSCVFGVDSDTMGEGYKDNQFMKVGDSFISSASFVLKFNLKSIWPRIFYRLGFKVVPPGVDVFFKKFIVSIFESRQYRPTKRNDFIDLILNFKQNDYIIGDSISNLKTGEDKKVKLPVTDDLMATQSQVFFIAGFETSATTTTYTLYYLAQYPQALKKVQAEIDAYLNKYENRITYDIMTELPYTFACVEEALRLCPVIVYITREVIEDYTLPSGVYLKKGTRIHIPLYHLHRDPKYFENPEKFIPERFIGEERSKIVPYSYMPFGEGGRICMGLRFAKMQVLAGLVTLLKKYDLELDESTPKQLKFQPECIFPLPKDPLTVKLTPRNGWESRVFVQE